jgi:hypothetical protein
MKSGIEQDRAEDVIHPGKCVQQLNACQDHGGTHDDGADNAKEEYPPLLRQFQAEGLKQYEKNE